MKKFLTALFIFLIATDFSFSQISENYVSGRVVVKFTKNVAPDKILNFTAKTNLSLGEIKTEKVFESVKNNGLNNIYFINYSAPADPEYVASAFAKNKFVEWAEPDYYGDLAGFVPNDSLYSEQWYLKKIDMENAWEIEQGADDLVVAVVDNGLSVQHPELLGHLWQNPNEIADGVDNDGNGLIDDIYGWDFGNNDNGIEHDGDSYHGTQVAGLIGAATNNNVGIASVGFNLKIMGLKITDLQSYTEVIMSAGYRAIVYAADNGADVINCSWGNYQFSHLGAEAVDYAIEHGAVVVAAAGNDGENEIFYPAKYGGALSVGATDSTDAKWDASNFGYYVDLMAPGENIISLSGENGYATASGTSLATPLVSGTAALVKNHFPDLSPAQVAERIRVSADDIYSANSSDYAYLLGAGRLNAYAALTNVGMKSVRASAFNFTDNHDNVFVANDTIFFSATFDNILSDCVNLQITISTDDPYLAIDMGNLNIGAVASGSSFSNGQTPFVLRVASNVPQNHKAYLRINYEDGEYSDFQWTEVLLNPTYSDMNINNLDLTITSTGTLGFTDYPYNSHGNGLTYMNDGKIRFFEAGFLYGASETQVMDALHITQFSSVSNDFVSVIPFHSATPGEVADQEGAFTINDDGAGTSKLGITTIMNSYAYSDEENRDYVILSYTLVNTTDVALEGVFAGLYFDWDLDEDDYEDDYALYDESGNFGYAYDNGLNTISTYQGVALISDSAYNFWANTNDGSNGGINVEQFTDDKKWTMLSSGLTHTEAGPSDISFVVSGGPYSIPADSSVTVAFAIAISPSLDELRNAIDAARTKFAEIPTDVENEFVAPTQFVLEQNYPNPFNPTTTISYSIPLKDGVETSRQGVTVSLQVFNSIGQKVATLVNRAQAAGNYTVQFDANDLPSGVYFYTLRAGNFVATKKMILMK